MFFKSKIQKIESLINQLSKEELHLVYNKIAQQLFLLRNEQQGQILKSLRIEDQVFFEHKNERIEGTIIKLNKISAGMVDTKNRHWKISPSLLTKIVSDK